MGITLYQADLMVQEHLHTPLPRTVHLLGRQTVRFDYAAACRLFARHGLSPTPCEVELDRATLGAQAGAGRFITDTTFFRMFGVQSVLAIDHSAYEGAEIIADLNRPLPDELKECADFIYGGSVLDNIFDPAAYIRNITQLLRPGGRLVDHNTCSFREHPYIAISPAWYFDYCVLNRFARCDVYVLETPRVACSKAPHVYALDVKIDDPLIADGGLPPAGLATYVTVVAEKGRETDWRMTPSQDQYRGAEEWGHYRDQLLRMREASRPARFSRPGAGYMPAYPLRNVRGLRYLGCFDPDLPVSAEPPSVDAFWSDTDAGIRVVEATYGWNQRRAQLPHTGLMAIHRGNVTGILAFLLNGQPECSWEVDVNVIGDPAPGMPKDLIVLYYFAEDADQSVRRVHVAAEAHGQRLHIPANGTGRLSSASPTRGSLARLLPKRGA